MDRRTFGFRMGALALLGSGILGACSEQISAGAAGGAPSAGQGRLSGRVTRGPTCAVARMGQECSEPARGLVLVVRYPSGGEAGRATLDAQGDYALELPAGTYRLEAASLAGSDFTKALPALIRIEAGRETRFDIGIDTGIR